MVKIKCCYKCEKRSLGCHANCDTYKSERKMLDDYNENVRKIKEEENAVISNVLRLCKYSRYS